MSRSATRRGMGELESLVMEALWDSGGWLTPGQVHELIGNDPPVAYTTVMTILVRLWEKGRLERQRDGRAYAYCPVLTREEQAAARMSEVLEAAGADRPLALSHFIQGLESGDRDQLRRLLEAAKRR